MAARPDDHEQIKPTCCGTIVRHHLRRKVRPHTSQLMLRKCVCATSQSIRQALIGVRRHHDLAPACGDVEACATVNLDGCHFRPSYSAKTPRRVGRVTPNSSIVVLASQ
jgi:hypothetical protein